MAEAAVEFLLDNLHQLLVYYPFLIKGAKEQVEKLDADLRLFKSFLKDTTKVRRNDDSLREIDRQIRDVVYEAEDTIDAFVTQAAINKTRSYFLRAFYKPVNLHGIAKQVEEISHKVNEIYNPNLATLNVVGDGAPPAVQDLREVEVPMVRQKNVVVGFEDEVEKIVGYLFEETEELDVITIVGMPGIGKTTLVWKIFDDEKVKYEFPTRIWVYVSQEFTNKDVYLAILRGFTTITQEMKDKTDGELAQRVYKQLQKGKYLIVLDDVCTPADWDKIQAVLPKSNQACKVLITSRNEDVALHANRQRTAFRLRFLTQHESWLLLQQEVFRNHKCPPELEIPGKFIVMECGGLPMAIVRIAGILIEKTSASSDNINLMKEAWNKVSSRVRTYLNEDPSKGMDKIIALSYDKMPYHLRVCFLYMGMFPEDYEIPVSNLIGMWIAEGFVRQQGDGLSLEEIAEGYLHELINRNLVRADKRRYDGRVKTCRIHNVIRYFCLSEAGSEKENFFLEMKMSHSHQEFEHVSEVVKRCRRICIHSNILNFISQRHLGPRVRSFVCFSKEEINLPPESASAIPDACKLLRVLEVKPMIFRYIPRNMSQLVHLRYLTLSITIPVLPQLFDKFWNLETLIVGTSCRTLEIKADIWKMNRLRHIKTNASAILPKVGKSSTKGENLQTLGTISPQSCTEQVLVEASNLKKLGIRGNLAALLDGNTVSFKTFAKLVRLEKLKLVNDAYPSPPSDGRLTHLPPPYQFPPRLKSLTLCQTFLDWEHISVLGLLESLEALKLKDNAFIGNFWQADDGCFRSLEILHIWRTDLRLWKASKDHYPRLRCLELHYCEELQEIPMGLADIPSFQMLNLYHSNNAASSAKKICDVKRMKWEEQNRIGGEFKLSIFPPQ